MIWPILRFLPRNLVSRIVGWLASRERPRPVVRQVQRWFVRHYDVDLAIAAQPLEAYPSLCALFTRRLKPGARVVDDQPETLVSPVDGRVGTLGRVRDGRLLQAKGLSYSLETLVGDPVRARELASAAYVTLYLAPKDYHRIHVPHDGRIVRTRHEPGTLWPVDPTAVRRVPSLFAVNERVVTWLETQRGLLAVVMVGAMNVGRIRLSYSDLVTNGSSRRDARELVHEPSLRVDRGAELGAFELGSTVILLSADATLAWTVEEGTWVPMGAAIGRFGR